MRHLILGFGKKGKYNPVFCANFSIIVIRILRLLTINFSINYDTRNL